MTPSFERSALDGAILNFQIVSDVKNAFYYCYFSLNPMLRLLTSSRFNKIIPNLREASKGKVVNEKCVNELLTWRRQRVVYDVTICNSGSKCNAPEQVTKHLITLSPVNEPAAKINP